MAEKEKHWEDDDGRTIADMSQVKRPSLSKQDRHAFFLGTMKASLLIGAAYLVGFGVFILILTLLFR